MCPILSGMYPTDSIAIYSEPYGEEKPQFYRQTEFDPTELVKDSAMLAKINAGALSGLQDVYTAVDYLNWAESYEMPHYINANTEISEFSLPSGIDTLPVFKTKAVIIADSIAGMCIRKVESSDSEAWDVSAAGVKLSASSAKKLDSLIVENRKDFAGKWSVPNGLLLYPLNEYLVSGKVLLNDKFDSYIITYSTFNPAIEESYYDYVKVGYLVNVRGDQLVSVALLTYSDYSIDCGTHIYGYLLDDGAILLQEHYFGGVNYDNSTATAHSIKLPINYYLYRITDEGAFRQLLPPGVAEGEDKQS